MPLSSFFRFFEKESHTAYALEALLFFPFRRALCVQGTIMLLRAPEALPRVSEREREREKRNKNAGSQFRDAAAGASRPHVCILFRLSPPRRDLFLSRIFYWER